jgi:hypothetical protein
LKSQCEQISRQLRGWANSLQNSDIQGQRYLNDQTRQEYAQQKRRTAFQEQLNAINEAAQQKRAARPQKKNATEPTGENTTELKQDEG